MLRSVGIVDALGTYAYLWTSNGNLCTGKERNYIGKAKTRVSTQKVLRLSKKRKRKKSNENSKQKSKLNLHNFITNKKSQKIYGNYFPF